MNLGPPGKASCNCVQTNLSAPQRKPEPWWIQLFICHWLTNLLFPANGDIACLRSIVYGRQSRSLLHCLSFWLSWAHIVNQWQNMRRGGWSWSYDLLRLEALRMQGQGCPQGGGLGGLKPPPRNFQSNKKIGGKWPKITKFGGKIGKISPKSAKIIKNCIKFSKFHDNVDV